MGEEETGHTERTAHRWMRTHKHTSILFFTKAINTSFSFTLSCRLFTTINIPVHTPAKVDARKALPQSWGELHHLGLTPSCFPCKFLIKMKIYHSLGKAGVREAIEEIGRTMRKTGEEIKSQRKRWWGKKSSDKKVQMNKMIVLTEYFRIVCVQVWVH